MITIHEAAQQRHAVRQYVHQPLSDEQVKTLQAKIDAVNAQGALHLQLITNDTKVFDSRMAHYGKFSGVENVIALVGKKQTNGDQKIGYYGAQVMLLAQQLGLNTCWVVMTYQKTERIRIEPGEKLFGVLALGYGATQGVPHKNKPLSGLAPQYEGAPEWFKRGVDYALLAPTASNQQKFTISYEGNVVRLKKGLGFYASQDEGIVRYFFELGAGEGTFAWRDSL
ncbi:MAG: nitroreductase family protein [Paludibacteraceae bacterium]